MFYTRLAQLRTAEKFAAYVQSLGIVLDFDESVLQAPDSPLANPFSLVAGSFAATLTNRFCIQPMEGWDATTDGHPTDLVLRRWQHFGQSGAKLIWGGEAVAIGPEARANPRQLIINETTLPDLARLRETLVRAHAARWRTDDLCIGLQLTHSGRFCRPYDKQPMQPRILYHHPFLDGKFGLPVDYPLLSDSDIEKIIEGYIRAAVLAKKAGFHFVDIKHCHGYLGHEFLSAMERPGKFGGSFENRTRFLRQIVSGIQTCASGLGIGVRLSAFDFVPFHPGKNKIGEPEPLNIPYCYAFGGDGTGIGIDLAEPQRFLDLLESLEINMVNITAGSPYYTPHIQRPAIFPPSDGYLPPEDPLVGVARQIQATAKLKEQHPNLLIVGTGYSYLQEWLPNVAQYVIRNGLADFIGIGRMVLSYPELCADVLDGLPLDRKHICRTFSDCTTGPRNGLVSGCYPLDAFYKERPEAKRLAEIKLTL